MMTQLQSLLTYILTVLAERYSSLFKRPYNNAPPLIHLMALYKRFTHLLTYLQSTYIISIKDIPRDVLLACVPQTAAQSNLSQLAPNIQILCPTMPGPLSVSTIIKINPNDICPKLC